YFLFLLFFFFQAEDGIRAATVTGVQTCALPISYAAGTPAYFRSSLEQAEQAARGAVEAFRPEEPRPAAELVLAGLESLGRARARSEERRVGRGGGRRLWGGRVKRGVEDGSGRAE